MTEQHRKSIPDEERPINVNDYQSLARKVTRRDLYEYLSTGTDDQQTIGENQLAFKRWYLRPRVMRSVGRLTTQTTFFGRPISMPVFVSPAGVQALCDPTEGECATARACRDVGIPFGLSQHATRSIEQVAAAVVDTTSTDTVTPTPAAAEAASAEANIWYQAYILKDRHMTLSLVHRAVQTGYRGIFLTVDSVRFGFREADARNGFNALPPPHRLANYDDPKQRQRRQQGGSPVIRPDETYNAKMERAWDQNSEKLFEQDVSWEDVTWLKKKGCPNLPLVVKGIMTAEDADLAIRAGADGVMVSNHGGRQLDGCFAAIDALPEVVAAVAGRVPVLLDGGIRRGTDVLKALALGATAVGLGQPVFFALAVGGGKAVRDMLQMLHTELEAAMAICGCQTVADITPSLVTRHPASGATAPCHYLRSAL